MPSDRPRSKPKGLPNTSRPSTSTYICLMAWSHSNSYTGQYLPSPPIIFTNSLTYFTLLQTFIVKCTNGTKITLEVEMSLFLYLGCLGNSFVHACWFVLTHLFVWVYIYICNCITLGVYTLDVCVCVCVCVCGMHVSVYAKYLAYLPVIH